MGPEPNEAAIESRIDGEDDVQGTNEHVERDLIEAMRLGELWTLVNLAAPDRSFKDVGDAMNIGQPAVSERLRRLEKWVGLPLKVETRRGSAFDPTPAAAEIVAASRVLLDHGSALVRLVLELRERSKGNLIRLAAGATASNVLIPRILGLLYRKRENITVDVTNTPSQNIVRGIREGRYDLGVVSAEVVARQKVRQLQWHEWIKDEYILAVPTDHRLAKNTSFEWRDLEGERLFLIERSGIRILMGNSAHKMKQTQELAKARIQELPSVQACVQATQNCAGLTLVSNLVANNAENLVHGIHVLPCKTPMFRTLFLVRDKDRAATHHQSEMWDLLVEFGHSYGR